MTKKKIEEYISELVTELYGEFRGTPSSNPIVRNNIEADAFALAVLKILYEKKLGLTFVKNNCDEIAEYVIAPPDSGIDIIIPIESGDDTQFDVIQIKYANQEMVEIQAAFSYMKKTVNDFCKNPKNVKSISCREALSRSGLDNSNKSNCNYFVVHTGTQHGNITGEDNETVLNLSDLDFIVNSIKYKVAEETFKVDKNKNVLKFGDKNQSAIVFNLNCYQLAELNNKYYSTDVGRNILFGYNLREMINPKQSRSFNGMKKTLAEDASNFWYYNNGITIVAENAVLDETEDCTQIDVSQFSIVNGAQTTSALGLILNEADRDGDQKLKENMQKAYVIARVLKVSSEDVQHNIAIFNNTQNPINFRDMVANNKEQRTLHELLIDDSYPQIYMEIRRGADKPKTFVKAFKHRSTTNEALAQLAFAGFFLDPGTAKDKKSAIFTNTNDENYLLNEYYHKIFYYNESSPEDNGILFKKTKAEIDELLFSWQLYKDCKAYLKKQYQELIDNSEKDKAGATPEEIINIESMISRYSRKKDTIGICMLFFVTAYANFKSQFDAPFNKLRYDYEKYYTDKKYQASLIEEASGFFLENTVNLLIQTAEENHKESNMNNWVRSKTCADIFIHELNDTISKEPLKYKKTYNDFMTKFKIVPM